MVRVSCVCPLGNASRCAKSIAFGTFLGIDSPAFTKSRSAFVTQTPGNDVFKELKSYSVNRGPTAGSRK